MSVLPACSAAAGTASGPSTRSTSAPSLRSSRLRRIACPKRRTTSRVAMFGSRKGHEQRRPEARRPDDHAVALDRLDEMIGEHASDRILRKVRTGVPAGFSPSSSVTPVRRRRSASHVRAVRSARSLMCRQRRSAGRRRRRRRAASHPSVADLARADHLRDDLQRALARVRRLAPASVRHRDLHFLARTERDAVQRTACLGAERLPGELDLDEERRSAKQWSRRSLGT